MVRTDDVEDFCGIFFLARLVSPADILDGWGDQYQLKFLGIQRVFFLLVFLVSFDAVGLSGSAVVEDGSGQVDVEAGRGLLGLPPSNDRLHLSSSAPGSPA